MQRIITILLLGSFLIGSRGSNTFSNSRNDGLNMSEFLLYQYMGRGA